MAESSSGEVVESSSGEVEEELYGDDDDDAVAGKNVDEDALAAGKMDVDSDDEEEVGDSSFNVRKRSTLWASAALSKARKPRASCSARAARASRSRPASRRSCGTATASCSGRAATAAPSPSGRPEHQQRWEKMSRMEYLRSSLHLGQYRLKGLVSDGLGIRRRDMAVGLGQLRGGGF